MNKVLLTLALISFSFYSFSQLGLTPTFTINPSPATVGENVVFTNTTTLDGSCGTATYSWNFGANGDASPTTANTVGPHTVVYNIGGGSVKTISLTVTQPPMGGLGGGCATGAQGTGQMNLTVNGALPVNLLSFTAAIQNELPVLSWATASELKVRSQNLLRKRVKEYIISLSK